MTTFGPILWRTLTLSVSNHDGRRAVANSTTSNCHGVYDHALRWLGEVKDNARARRGEVDLWTGSSYALRRLGRTDEAPRRLDAAFTRLQELKMYPSDQVALGFEADAALRAVADRDAETGNLTRAETYRKLLDVISAAHATAEKSLTAAADGAVTRNVFGNDVRLVQNATTPGNGTEPGYALTVAANGTVSQ